jgi:hypothetical protein
LGSISLVKKREAAEIAKSAVAVLIGIVGAGRASVAERAKPELA